MVYVTYKIKPKPHQISFTEMMKGVSEADLVPVQIDKKSIKYKTKKYVRTPTELKQTFEYDKAFSAIFNFNKKYQDLINTENKEELYHSFKIPKRSGGLRQIDAPKDELMHALYELKIIFETYFFASNHDCAFAYVKGRCAVDSVKRHQENKSNWFLKLDFHNFFGSTTQEFIENQLQTIFPFNIFFEKGAWSLLRPAISLCFLNGGLPQGTPMSPLLTNLMMIPIDDAIKKALQEKLTPTEKKQGKKFVYTRYADDILISNFRSFMFTDVIKMIKEILASFNAPFELNEKKTRYGSKAGRNWNLGVMLNKDNNITIGYRKIKTFKASIFQFLTDFCKNKPWSLEDTRVLNGQISYYRSVEGENIDKILETYSRKFDCSVMDAIKSIIAN